MTDPAAGCPRSEAGFTLLDLLFVIALIGLLSTLAIPGLVRARMAAHSASALATIRVVNSAQLNYAVTCGLGFYAPDFPTLGMKPAGGADAFLPDELTAAPTFQKGGYVYSMAATPLPGSPASCNGLAAGRTAAGYALVADQIAPPPGSGRFFGANADGIIYEDAASLAATMPESGAPLTGAPVNTRWGGSPVWRRITPLCAPGKRRVPCGMSGPTPMNRRTIGSRGRVSQPGRRTHDSRLRTRDSVLTTDRDIQGAALLAARVIS